MAATFIAAVSGSNDAAGTTLDSTASLNVAAGDLLVSQCTNEGGSSTRAIAKNDGSGNNSFTFDAGDAIDHTDGILSGQFGYRLVAVADATFTPRLTTASKPFRRFIVAQWRPDAGKSFAKDASSHSATNANGASRTSGNISTAGTDEVVVGSMGEDDGSVSSAEQINGVAATEPTGSPIPGPAGAVLFYRILSATFSGGAATCTGSGGGNYVCGVIAFKADFTVPQNQLAWVTA